jgi:preprotein translocase subunit SecG
MSFLAGILTVLLVANCLVLIFLVLVQLPKKDAGAGIAFGGGAADALFGAGSGNVLTKITKWAAGIFFALALLLGYSEVRLHRSNATEFEKAVEQKQTQMPIAQPTTTAAPAAASETNQLLLPVTPSATTAPVPAGTNSPQSK